ncbi:hypothetical protein QJS10_CPA01g01786 [Acorus calamus]|uniref:Uncharacterized protein n=1 Tax=Acorus calamus TaxID=4465 RepID=A0AAV9FIC3_ACOCL|nr:hypothetical protein QJS10_CPA01g01786 [Acorus calamus]
MEVQASKVLPESVLVELAQGKRESFKLEYDWKPLACQHYAIKARANVPSLGKNSTPSSSNKIVLSQANPNAEIIVVEFQAPQRQQSEEQENQVPMKHTLCSNKFALLQDEKADGEGQQQQVECEEQQYQFGPARVEGMAQKQQLESQKNNISLG